MPSQQTSNSPQQTPCEFCAEPFIRKSPRQRFCGVTCRSRSYRSGGAKPRGDAYKAADAAPVAKPRKQADQPDQDEPRLVVATRKALTDAGRLDTFAGQQAMHLAEQMTSNKVAIGVAALNKELTASMERALLNVVVADDPVDEVKAQRDRKRRTS